MHNYPYPRPALTTDVVIFSLRQQQLQLLLVKGTDGPYKGKWALPGGFVQHGEDLMQGAQRVLQQKTGVGGVFLEQLYTFGGPGRDPRKWAITVAYFALIPSDQIALRPATSHDTAEWFALDKLPSLALDHMDIVNMAQARLVAKLEYSTIAIQFLAPTFTLSELQGVYEIIQREQLDKRNFRKWILATNHIEETGEERRDGAHRPAKLYRVKHPGKVALIK